MSDDLPMWTVYENPRDMPGWFVARLSLTNARGIQHTDRVIIGRTLDEVRARLPPGLYRLERDPKDDPVIVEVWL